MTKRYTETIHNAFHLYATLGPIGYLPFAPGTYGSALACIFLYFFPSVFTHPLIIVVLTGAALVALNSISLDVKDPGYVVIDEVIGMFTAMAFHRITPYSLLAGFGLFRLLDIAKPFPIRKAEALPKGYGILADDIAAGIVANLLLLLLWRILP